MPFDGKPSFGDVLLVPFPFTDQTSAKQRPAVVVSSRAYSQDRPDVILMAITSQVRAPIAFGEALVADWQTAGLIKVSVFKPLLMTLEQSLIIRQLGKLSSADQVALTGCLKVVLG
jgi:mRNA interferase MazF